MRCDCVHLNFSYPWQNSTSDTTHTTPTEDPQYDDYIAGMSSLDNEYYNPTAEDEVITPIIIYNDWLAHFVGATQTTWYIGD